jgi:hypothetical protein
MRVAINIGGYQRVHWDAEGRRIQQRSNENSPGAQSLEGGEPGSVFGEEFRRRQEFIVKPGWRLRKTAGTDRMENRSF